MGRPSSYREETAERLLAQLSVGRSLATVCKQDDMPSVQTVFNWMRVIPTFLERYARAKEEAADALADQIVDIADEQPPTDEDGRVDNGAVQHQRLRVEARKWIAAKLKPKRYGDRITQEHSGPNGAPIVVVTGVPQQPGLNAPQEVAALPQPMLLDVPLLPGDKSYDDEDA